MFDREALRIAQKTIDAELPARRVKFANELGRAKSEIILKGGGQSGAMLHGVAEVCATEAEARADRLWRILYRAIIATGVEWSSDLADQLKEGI